MAQKSVDQRMTLALNTALENEFVTPLTSVRGSLEILRDFPDLSTQERAQFLEMALTGCARLERGIENLASSVYAEATDTNAKAVDSDAADESNPYRARIHFLPDCDTVDVDFSDFIFRDSHTVNEFYDELDSLIEQTGHKWYITVNYRMCRIWPDAWVAFAHRGKKVTVSYSLGTVRYIEPDGDDDAGTQADDDMFASREEALARIAEIKAAAAV